MEKSSKQSVGSVIKLETKIKADEFFFARVKLTFFYSLTTTIILAGASFLLYRAYIANLIKLIQENNIDPLVAQRILDRAQDLLQIRFLTIDLAILLSIVFFSFFLTQETLKPIRNNAKKQKRFIADASHELRTPVAVAISGLEVALRNKNLDIATARTTLQNTLEEMKELSKLSNHLLDIVKFNNQDKLVQENVVITDLVKSVTGKMQSLALHKNIVLKIELKNPTTIKGNRIELERVFYNILDNAITHTPQGGYITVADSVDNNNYLITIKDTGAGIPKDVLTRVFDPFFQGDASRSLGGAGLGLTLSKKIIENHKGRILIKSEVGVGTEVSIFLPI